MKYFLKIFKIIYSGVRAVERGRASVWRGGRIVMRRMTALTMMMTSLRWRATSQPVRQGPTPWTRRRRARPRSRSPDCPAWPATRPAMWRSGPLSTPSQFLGKSSLHFRSDFIQIQIVIANLSAFDFKYSGIFLSSRNIGVLNAGILSISRNIGSAVAPPVQLPL